MSRISNIAYNQAWTQNTYSGAGVLTGHLTGTIASETLNVTRGEIVKTARPWPIPLRPLAYSTTIVEKKDGYGVQRYFNTTGHTSYVVRSGALGGSLVTTFSAISAPAVTAGQRNTCVVRALLNLKDQKVNVAQAFAEAHQVVSTIADAAKTVCLAARAVKKGNVLLAAKVLGVSLSDKRYRKAVKRFRRKEFAHLTNPHKQWLSLQYGWKPMLMDIDGAARDFANRNTANPQRMFVTVQGSMKVVNNFITETTANSPNAYKRECRTKQEIKVKLWFSLANQTLATAAAQGWSNPESLAWELLPFSFVADWFIPIGNYLNTLDATNGWDFITGFRTEYLVGSSKNPWWTGTHIDFIGGNLDGYTRNVSFSRIVFGTSPLPELPRLKNPLSGVHLANAIALVKEVFGRKH